MSSGYEMHVIPNTHWDREWLYDFQETRMQLVDLFKVLMEMLQSLGSYVKLAVDVRREVLAGGGELHADCEQVLLEDGSR